MGAKPTSAVVVVLFGKRETVSTGGGGVILGERAIKPGITTLKTYTYSASEWGDLLTSYNGNAITYDALGNPLSYHNGMYRFNYTWEGRRLVGASREGKQMSFTYDDNGLRTSKTVNGITTEYYWNGNLLVAEKTPYNLIVYNYDATGRPIGMAYRENGYTQYQWDVFWFDLNVFGDVVAVYDNNGTKLLTYTYDPWGYGEVGYVNGGEFSQAKRNRIAYRGYYYDSDLDLYYLQSRYYDPSTKRFINADSYISTGQGILGYNMYAYCNNNPVNYVDYGGSIPGNVMVDLRGEDGGYYPYSDYLRNAFLDAAIAAEKAGIDFKNEHTIDFKRSLIENFDRTTLYIFYTLLYQRSVTEAATNNITADKIMSIEHIRWETEWHLAASFLSNTDEINLNYSETKASMIGRGFEAVWLEVEKWLIP